MRIIFVLVLTAFAFSQTSPAESPTTPYAVASVLKIGGTGRWDYVAVDENHRLFVTRTDHTQVIDPNSGKVVADIKGGSHLHGTAIVPSLNQAYVSDGKEGKLLVVDLKTMNLLGKIDAADDADGIIYDPASNCVLVSCGDADALVLVSPSENLASIKATKIDLGGKPEFLAADGKGHAFVCINNKNEIAAVDLKSQKVVNRWPCGTGTAPTGLAIDIKRGRLFVGCRNQKLIVMNTENGKVEAEFTIGKGNDACAFNPATDEAFASCGDGTMSVIKTLADGTYAIEQTVKTRPGAKTLGLDAATGTIYLPTADLAPAEAGKRPVPIPDTFCIVVVKNKQSGGR